MKDTGATISHRRRAAMARRVFRTTLAAIVASAFLQVTAFASGAELFSMSEAEFNSQFQSQITKIYNLIHTISLPIAVVGFAASCFTCLFGNQRDIEKAMRHVLFILIAIVCLQLVPAVVALARNVFSSYTYTPPSSYDPGRNLTF